MPLIRWLAGQGFLGYIRDVDHWVAFGLLLFIGGVAFALTYFGTRLGPVFGKVAGKKAELFGGLILIFIGIKILTEHL
jgi:putative Mn2+ efflux pump MntP